MREGALLSILLMERRGRKTRSTLSGFRLGMLGKNSSSLGMREEGLPSDDNYKIEPVPCISKIGVAMEDESHCNDLHDELEGEDACEEEAAIEDEVVIG